jgi:signal transduction histidine kinase
MGALFAEQIGVEVRVGVGGTPLLLGAAQQTLLLRTAQEALLNVQRHAQAQHVAVQLRYTLDTITLTIQDDGIGLLDGTYERPGMHALRSLRYRLAEFDGQLSVFEGESGGVTVRAMLPHGCS